MRRLSPLAVALAALFVFPASPAAAATLKPVTLEAPATEAIVEASPTFTWRALSGARTYEFQIAADRLFGSISQTTKTRNTAATLKGTLVDGTYFWRVRGVSASNKVGRWSPVREVDKRWRTAPELVSPTSDFGAVWPSLPLVLNWSSVPHATDYKVVVANDPSLAQPVLGSPTNPQITQGTVLAFPGTLNAGTYYWQITPRDADGHPGTPSAIGRFSWGWPSALAPTVSFPNPAPEVSDPLLSWTAVPGAERYDVEVNTTPDFAPGSTFFTTTIAGTSVAPVVPVPNNTYYWRVRAVDPDGRAGQYFSGSFRKAFDDAVRFTPPRESITGLTLRDGASGDAQAVGSTLANPVLTWDPVPGAAEYQVQVAERTGPVCNWTPSGPLPYDENVHNPFSDLRNHTKRLTRIGTSTWPFPEVFSYFASGDRGFDDGGTYCVRVLARDGAGVVLGGGVNDSQYTYLGGSVTSNTLAFTFDPPTPPAEVSCQSLPQPTHSAPADGTLLPRSPQFRWSPVPGARSYFVVVSRDESFTEIVEVAHVTTPFYSPGIADRVDGPNRDTYEDEETSYYWQVLSSSEADGDCAGNPAAAFRFDKRSGPPTLLTPADGAVQSDQPVFGWTAAEGAAQYRIQVARDLEFRDLIDDVTTRSTSYASTETYPVDTQLYWRVRAEDVYDIGLRYSPVRTFRRTLPPPVTDASNPTSGSTIPVLTWQPVQGATSYGFHVDKVDGKSQDFTVATTRFTPTEFYGNGIWRWKVRANFPTSGGSSDVSGPFSETREYVRRLLPPTSTRAVNVGNRVVFSWNPDPSGKKYKLEVAQDDSFTDKIESVITPNTSYAPLLDRRYEDGGRLYWRVAVQDSGNNLGAFARGDLRRPARLILKTKVRRLKRKSRATVLVTVTDPRGTKQRGATVTATGAGAKGRKKTNSKGTVTLRLRPTRSGTVTLKASRKGYVTGTLTIRAY